MWPFMRRRCMRDRAAPSEDFSLVRMWIRTSLLGLAIACGATTVRAETPEGRVLTLINKERAKAGCPALVAQPQMTEAAELHARDMAESNFFAHEGLDGSSPGDRMRAQGYGAGYWGENIAAGQKSAAEAVSGWMKSPGHRANILNCRYTETGIGMTHQANDAKIAGQTGALFYYWVNDFARP